MCLMCQGWTREQVLELYVEKIRNDGWTIVTVEGDRARPPLSYTVGLTRFHDHPELVMSGLTAEHASKELDELARHVEDGHRYSAGDVIMSFSPHRYSLLRVNDPRRLTIAQEVYGLGGAKIVPALQVVWSNHDGQWPWDRAWHGGLKVQQVFGRPRPSPV
ncbi:DUF4262 domain-containing protein [Georgenia sp. SYP-B2076]|uniref:DUF4262 domain-containing protein n=1 Tax=Georgenia sp. SYP-B2076 TaxID=2495881 RepID=UPI000F8E2FF2|nr:DUF4262 domain-containing protein [Georgenia sp. SYP-B2076]